jgi:hypothetical protein
MLTFNLPPPGINITLLALILVAMHGRIRKTLWNGGFILSEMKHGRPAYAGREELDIKSSKSVGLPHGAVIAFGTMVFLCDSRRLNR